MINGINAAAKLHKAVFLSQAMHWRELGLGLAPVPMFRAGEENKQLGRSDRPLRPHPW